LGFEKKHLLRSSQPLGFVAFPLRGKDIRTVPRFKSHLSSCADLTFQKSVRACFLFSLRERKEVEVLTQLIAPPCSNSETMNRFGHGIVVSRISVRSGGGKK